MNKKKGVFTVLTFAVVRFGPIPLAGWHTYSPSSCGIADCISATKDSKGDAPLNSPHASMHTHLPCPSARAVVLGTRALPIVLGFAVAFYDS